MTFSNSSRELTGGFTPATADQVRHYAAEVSQLTADGGTNLHAGLLRGLRALDDDRSSGVILVTDGVANVGITEKKDFLDLMQQHDVRLFTFIMGNSANTPLLEAMTEVSSGFAMSASNSDDIAGQLMLATGKLSHHAMHGVDSDHRSWRSDRHNRGQRPVRRHGLAGLDRLRHRLRCRDRRVLVASKD